MRRLTLVGLSDDGTELLFTAEAPKTGPESRDGQYVLALDDQLHAALRHDRARLGQLQLADPTALRPRDIQARVRSGEAPEEIAAAAGVPVARVLVFARPVLAEREHVAEVAQVAVLRRRSGAAQTLGEAVAAAAARAGQPATAAFDAHRRPDGSWLVRVSGVGPSTASFVFDPAARSVVAEDAAARDLVAEPDPAAPAIPVSYDTRITRFDSVAAGSGADRSGRGQDGDPSATPSGPVLSGQPEQPSPTAVWPPAPDPVAAHRDGGRGRRALRYLAFRDEPGEEPSTAGADDTQEGADERAMDISARQDDRTDGRTGSTPGLPASLTDTGDPELPAPPATQRGRRRPAVPSWTQITSGRDES